MASSVKVAVIHDTAAASATTKTYKTSRLGGKTPKAVLIFAGNVTADGSLANNAIIGWGASSAANTTDNRTASISNYTGGASSDTDRRGDDDWALHINATSPAATYACSVSAFVADSGDGETGVTLDFGGSAVGSQKITIVLFAGDDLQATVGSFVARDSGASLSVGTTWRPSLAFFFGIGMNLADTSAVTAVLTFGVAVDDGANTQAMFAGYAQDAAANANPNAYLRNDAIACQISGGTEDWRNSVAFTATGFDVSGDNGLAGSDVVYYLALDLGDRAAWTGLIDTPTATGTQSYTGPSFEPQALGVVGTMLAAANAVSASANAGCFGMGASDGVGEGWHGYFDYDAAATMLTRSNSEALLARLYKEDGAGTGFSEAHNATVNSFDASGFTLNFSVTDASARKWLAWAIEAEAGGATVTLTASLDAAVQRQNQLAQASMDAAIRRATTATAAVDAALSRVLTATAQLDAAARATKTNAASLDAAVQAVRTGQASLDAALSSVRTGAASLDAALEARRTLSASLDAYLVAEGSASVSASLDAAIQMAMSVGASLDAAVAAAVAASVSLDAALASARTVSVSMDAVLTGAGTVIMAMLDAALQKAMSVTASLDGAIQRNGLSASASLDAALAAAQSVAILLDVAVARAQSAETDLDAALEMARTLSVGLDAKIGAFTPSTKRTSIARAYDGSVIPRRGGKTTTVH